MPPATAGVTALITALRSDDPAPAYALLAESVRAQVSYEDFAASWEASAAERHDRARALEADLAGSAAMGERTRITYGGGKSVYLLREDGRWRLETALMSRSHASRPGDAVRLFARALVTRDFDAVMRLLTSRRREHIGRRLQGFVTSLSEHLDEGIDTLEIIGDDRAELRWDQGDTRYRIILRKEGDEWRVDDVYLRPAAGTAGGTQ